jgi:hypothetical protein
MRRLLLTLLFGGIGVYAAGALVIKHSAHPGPDATTTAHLTAKPTAASIVSSWPSEPGESNGGQSAHTEVFAQMRGQAPQLRQSHEGDTIWAKVSRAAELLSGPSSYAALMQSLGVGTELKVVWRKKDGWVQVVNPATSQRGWMREQDLSWGSGRGHTEQKAMQTTAEAPVEVSLVEHEAPTVKQRSRKAKLVSQKIGSSAADKAVARSDDQSQDFSGRRRTRHTGPLGLFGLF